jgi:ABC-2 type transport system permease protein
LMLLIALELTVIGFVIAWPMSSTQGYHAIMSVFLMPMWLLSGAFFPGGDTAWLSWIIRLNPLTYGVAALRRLLYTESLAVTPELPSLLMCLCVTSLTLTALVVLAIRMVARPSTHNVV